MGTKVVVVGGGVAGVSAALGAAKSGADVTLVESSGVVGVSKAHLPLLLREGWDEGDLVIPEARSLEGEGVTVQTEATAEEVRQRQRRVLFRGGRGTSHVALDYDSLVVCTGASLQAPRIRGATKQNVFLLDRREAYSHLSASVGEISLAALSGPVPLALKVGEALALKGTKVSIYCGEGGLDAQFSPRVARMVRAASKRRSGVALVEGHVDSILGVGRAEAVTSRGAVSPCDAVVLIPRGGAPPSQLLDCERGPEGGILVDSSMATSVGGVYAAGDSTEVRFKSGSVAARLYSASRTGGEVAGVNAAGGNARASLSWAFEDEYFGLEFCSAGLGEEEARAVGLEAASVSHLSSLVAPRAGGQARADRELYVSLVYDRSSHEVYGLRLAGWRASSYSNTAALIVSLGVRVEDLAYAESPCAPGSSYGASPIGLTARSIESGRT